jgi:hypothetical protein
VLKEYKVILGQPALQEQLGHKAYKENKALLDRKVLRQHLHLMWPQTIAL